MKEIDSINEFNMLLKLESLICSHTDSQNLICKILDAFNQQQKLHTYIGISKYHNRFFSFTLGCMFTFLCLVVFLHLWNLLEF